MYHCKKTFVIGIGETGLRSILEMKRIFFNTFGEIPPMIKFLVLDTSEKYIHNIKKDDIKFKSEEFLKIDLIKPEILLRNYNDIQELMSEGASSFAFTERNKKNSLESVSLIANSTFVEDTVVKIISSLRDLKNPDYTDRSEQKIIINIVCSYAKAGRSSYFLHLSEIVRKNLLNLDKLIASFLVPDVFISESPCFDTRHSAYISLREINYYFATGSNIIFKVKGIESQAEDGLFDLVFLINNINNQGDKYAEISHLEEFIGNGMFLLSRTMVWQQIYWLEDKLRDWSWMSKGFPILYSSFSIYELIFPGERFAIVYAHKIAQQVIQKFFIGGKVEEIKEDVEDFIDRIGIREDTADEVINSILIPGEYPGFPLPKDFNRDTIDPTFERVKLHLNNARREFIETAKENLTVLKERKLKEFDDYIQDRLKRLQKVQYCNTFIASFIDRMIEFKNMIIEEKETYQSKRKNFDSAYHLIWEEATQAGKHFFFRNSAIEKALKRLKELIDQEVVFLLEIERREEAIEFFTYFIDLARDWLDRLKKFSDSCKILNQELDQDIRKYNFKEKDKNNNPFIEEIKPQSFINYIPKVEPDDFLIWLHEDKKLSFIKLADMKLSELKSLLLDYAYSQEKVKEIKEKTADEVFRELSPKERVNYLGFLNRIVNPVWLNNRNSLMGEHTIQDDFLFGLEYETIPEFEEITKTLYPRPLFFSYNVKTPKGILYLKIAHICPSFTINNIRNYRKKCAGSENNKPSPNYLDKYWERELQESFPIKREQKAIKYWALGISIPFYLIKKAGGYYYIYSEKKGEKAEGYWFKLEKDRVKAMKSFLKDSELVKEIAKNVTKKVQQLGNTSIVEQLVEYREKFETVLEDLKNNNCSILKLVILEQKEIDKYIKYISK